jgi:hypothetical protein
MVTTEQETPGSATVAQHWPARQALVAGIAAEHNIPLLVISAGTRNHFALDPFGAYAAVVQSPAYRDDKRRTTTETLPGLLAGQQGPRLAARAGDVTIKGPQAVLVSNNVYGMGDIAGLGRRARLDRAPWACSPSRSTAPSRRPGRWPGPTRAGSPAGRTQGRGRHRCLPDPGRGRR